MYLHSKYPFPRPPTITSNGLTSDIDVTLGPHNL